MENQNLTPVDEVRLELFFKKHQRKKREVVISCVKKMESSFLLPLASVLKQKTNRTNHIAEKLLLSWMIHPPISNPLNCGKALEDKMV